METLVIDSPEMFLREEEISTDNSSADVLEVDVELKEDDDDLLNMLDEEETPKVFPVRVAVHLRPYLPHEEKGINRQGVDASEVEKTVELPLAPVAWGSREEKKRFTFDFVYKGGKADQQGRVSTDRLYEQCVLPLLGGCFNGLNATVLAYGQTGSGKTFTMGSSSGAKEGVIPRVARDLFDRVRALETKGDVECSVSVSFFEIYREIISDLLLGGTPQQQQRRDFLSNDSNSGLAIREDPNKNVFVAGLTQVDVGSESELLDQLITGCLNRATGSTEMNKTSSRSHAVFTINITTEDKVKGIIKTSKFHLVDLAGSERAKKTKAKGTRFAEGVDINLGLLALGNVISALGDDVKCSHVPYRDSKLTRILQDSLGGNSRTLMVACISPAETNYEETLSTLRYANRARKIKNKPVKNNHHVDLMKVVRDLRQKNATLEEQLRKEMDKSLRIGEHNEHLSMEMEQIKDKLHLSSRNLQIGLLAEENAKELVAEMEAKLLDMDHEYELEMSKTKQHYEERLYLLQQHLERVKEEHEKHLYEKHLAAQQRKIRCFPTPSPKKFRSPFKKIRSGRSSSNKSSKKFGGSKPQLFDEQAPTPSSPSGYSRESREEEESDEIYEYDDIVDDLQQYEAEEVNQSILSQ